MATKRRPRGLAPEPGTTLRLALVDLGATPEDDTHGRFLQALRAAAPGVPLVLLADASAFDRRFAGLPARGAERRQAWQQWAAGAGRGLRRRGARKRGRGCRRSRPRGRAVALSPTAAMTTVTLSLVSHTNAGKTTLARTLLGTRRRRGARRRRT